ncbi:MAG: ASPIC/UnbV domain-containing protein, partial [Thermoanaerobaculia bacterium]|nr:ASPIC/UnbV domain-containing protein [Thermoanaerobaculia bacterium]
DAAAVSRRQELGDYVEAWLAILEMTRQGDSWSGRERHTVYLNTADGRFADVSAVSGIDYPDDGRAVAWTDWDTDGDLDLWMASRTGPRVRLLANRIQEAPTAVTVRLRGTRSNRDGVGARLRLLPATGGEPLAQSLRAGEGFLAQSSKWLLFPLSSGTTSADLEVTWPGGRVERFEGLTAGGRYLATEGTGRLEPAPAPSRAAMLTPSEPEPPAPPAAAHIRLTARPLMPPLAYHTLDGEARALVADGRALLVNLWASWCAPCVGELRELDRQRDELARAGLDILALTVDEDLSRARSLIDRLGTDLEFGVAPEETLDILDVLQKALLEERRRLALPSSFLIDGQGRLAVLYRGTIAFDELWSDLDILALDPFASRAAIAPLPGRWSTVPPVFPHHKLAGEMAAFGHSSIADLYYRIAESGRLPEGGTATPATDPLGRDLSRAIGRLATDRAAAEELLVSVIERLIERLLENPADLEARSRLGVALLAMDRPGVAVQAFEQVLERDPRHRDALLNLTVLYWRAGRREESEELVERLSGVDPAAAAQLRQLMALAPLAD